MGSIAITLTSITLHHDARRQECLQEEERGRCRQGGARRQEDGEDKSRSKAEEGEEAKGAEAKGKEKGCSRITWISIQFYHQFQFIVVTLCLKTMNKRFVL